MIDVCQWRVSIGRWNCCHIPTSRSANGYHRHSAGGTMTLKLVAILAMEIMEFFLYFLNFSKGNYSQVIRCTAATCMNWLQFLVAVTADGSLLVYYLVVCFLHLLLSGDIELNPGPTIDDRPEVLLLLQWLDPLVNWQSFGLQLPGITQDIITMIEQSGMDTKQQKETLFTEWLDDNPGATWSNVIVALYIQKETELAEFVSNALDRKRNTRDYDDEEDERKQKVIKLKEKTEFCVTSTGSSYAEGVITASDKNDSKLNPNGTTTDELPVPRDLLRKYSDALTKSISTNLSKIANALYTQNLIPSQTKEEMLLKGVQTDYEKATKLMTALVKLLDSSIDSKKCQKYLTDICNVLIKQEPQTLRDIAKHILQQLGEPIPNETISVSLLPDNVQGYIDAVRDKYRSVTVVVAVDWLPRIKDSRFFGKLGLVEKQDSQDIDEKIASWHMLRGKVDKIPNLFGLNEISIEEVLETKVSQSLRVVVDGPPGIGKTTLCRKLLNIWSNGTLHQQYDLALYCPLRDSRIANANTLAELLKAVYESDKVPEVVAWLSNSEGKGLLIIFDGWDEMDAQSRESSFAARIFRSELLNYCAVIITSRSYASSSLLEMDTHSKHVQVIGFSEEEVNTVIINTLQKDSKLAQELLDKIKKCSSSFYTEDNFIAIEDNFIAIESNNKDSQLAVQLINEVRIRTDVQSLCYIPLVCSMVIFVYSKEKKLPKTLTLLYETFILHIIKRHIKKRHSEIDHKRILSLNDLPLLLQQPFQEMCRLAYTSLKNETNKMTFSSDQLQDYSSSEAAKEDYLGLMTSFEDYEEWYQFIHLSIQEFLAAWWIAKHEEKTEEVFKTHFDDDHFRMCLRFVAGLTHLEHESYQQYFNKQLDLQCKTRPLFGFYALCDSCFTSYPSSTGHFKSVHFDKFPILLLQLLYESQSTALCRVLAQSIKDSTLCLNDVQLSSFDMMCLGFFIDNSNITWNYLDLISLRIGNNLSIFFDALTNQTTTSCKKCEIGFNTTKKEEIVSLSQPSHLLHNIEEFYFNGGYIPFCMFSLPKIKVLHIEATLRDNDTSDCSKLEKCIESNTTLQGLHIILNIELVDPSLDYIIGAIRGLTRHKSITSFSLLLLCVSSPVQVSLLPDGVIVDLLKYNKTLKTLSLLGHISYCSPQSLNMEDVNTPLTALRINSEMVTSFLPHINGLQHLKLCKPLPPLPPELIPYSLPPSLQTLELELEDKSAAEFFNILQSNTTLKGLRVSMKKETFTNNRSIGISLRDMLTYNQTLQYLDITIMNTVYMPFLITGLKNNTSLQQLTISIQLLYSDDDDQLKTFFNVISQKSNLTELDLTFFFVTLHHLIFQEMEQPIETLFHKQVLPAVTSMLQSHTTMRLLELKYRGITEINYETHIFHFATYTDLDQFRNFYKTIFNHISLEYVSIEDKVILEKTFKEQEKARLQEEAPH